MSHYYNQRGHRKAEFNPIWREIWKKQRVFRNYSTPLQGVRELLILNRLTYGLPTFGFAGATIWWFKLFFLQNACTLLRICIYFNVYLSREKLTSNHFYRKFKKKKLLFKQFFVFILDSEINCQNLAIFSKLLTFTRKLLTREKNFFRRKMFLV